jgi:hypothetical protein
VIAIAQIQSFHLFLTNKSVVWRSMLFFNLHFAIYNS